MFNFLNIQDKSLFLIKYSILSIMIPNKKLEEEIIKVFYPGPKGLSTKQVKRMIEGAPELQRYKEYLDQRFIDSNSYPETLKRIKNNILEKPKCPYCGNPVKFIGKPSHLFQKYCSTSCRAKDVSKTYWIEGQKKYNLEKYGVEHNFQREDVKEKRKQTLIEKYGTDNPLNNDKIKYNVVLNIIKNRNWYRGNIEDLKEINQLEDFIYDFCKIKNVDKPEIFDIQYAYNKLYSEVIKSEEVQEKRSKTLKNHYNTDNLGEVYKQSYLDKYNQNISDYLKISEVRQKSHDTKKKNHSFSISKPEIRIYNLIKEKYDDIIHQYRDKNRYPFNCDYYIPSLDLFIEYQGMQDHGGHPYDSTNQEDNNKVNKWKEMNEDLKQRTGKTKTRYDKMIYGWTIADPHKREVAKQNNLNYLEIWPNWTDEKILDEIKKFHPKEN